MRWKWIAGLGLIIVIALLLAVYGVLATYDYNKLKPQVARMVKDATGRELHLGGEIDLAIGLSPSLVVSDVTFANASWGSQPQMIKVEKLQVQVRLLPLLLKKVELEHIGLAGVEVLLETDSKGKGNWEFRPKTRSEKSVGPSGPFQLDIDRIRIENFALVFRNGITESEKRLTIIRLDMARQGAGDTQTVDLRTEYNGQAVAITGTTGAIHKLSARQRFPLKLAGKLADASVTIDGAIDDILDLTGIDLELNGSGRDLSVIGPIIGAKLPATDNFALKGRLTGSAKALSLKDAQGSASRGSLRLTLNGAVQDFFTLGGMDLESMLSGKDLTDFGNIIGVKLPTTDEFEIQGRLTGSTDVLALRAAKASAGRGSMRLSLKGAVKDLLTLTGMDLQSRLSGREMAELGPLVGSNLPNLGPFDVSGQLTGSTQALAIKAFTATLDKSDFKGLAQVEFHARPKITLRLESSVVDFTPLMESPEKDKPKSDEASPRKRRFFSDTPLPLAGLQKVDADIVLKARQIHARNARFDLGHLSIKLENRDLSIDKFEATYKKTKIAGNLHIDHGAPPRVATNFMVQDFDLGSYLKETGVSDQVRAHIDIAAQLKGRGNSVHSLMAALDGSIGAVMGEGYLTKYLDMLSVDLSQKVISFWGRHEEADQIKCAVVQFDIKEGVATSQAFVFDSQIAVLTGEGDINLGTEQVNFLLDPNPKKPGILKLPIKLRVGGTIMDPTVSADKLSILAKGSEALSALAIGPLGLLAPFAHLGAHEKHPCDVKSIGQSGPGIPAQEQAPSP
ncbi:MAG: AsmA family protein [Desulfosarcina sp.]|nr:AsmA family protein [Desulfobacterales bacterium]